MRLSTIAGVGVDAMPNTTDLLPAEVRQDRTKVTIEVTYALSIGAKIKSDDL